MASIRSIRKRTLKRMGREVRIRAWLASRGPWVSFDCVDDALAHMVAMRCVPDGAMSPVIHGDGSGAPLPLIDAPRPA